MNKFERRFQGTKNEYTAIHKWIAYRYGTPEYCEHCKRTDKKRYEWANKSGEYKRKITDWERLCVRCHRIKDGIIKGIWCNTGRTHFRKGQKAWNEGTRGVMKPNQTSFKKGSVPANKYLQPTQCQQCKNMFQPRTITKANKFCSHKCYWESRKGMAPWNKGIKKNKRNLIMNIT